MSDKNFCPNSVREFYSAYIIQLKCKVHVLSNFLKLEYVS
jgi:hypothetical protein